MIELVEIAVERKAEKLVFPGQSTAADRQATLTYDPDYLGCWVAERMEEFLA